MNIELTEIAKKTFQQIISQYNEYKAAEFSKKTVSTIEIIANNNYIGSRYKATSFRKLLISNNVYLFYKIERQTLYIIVFWNNKRNPEDLEIVLSS
jgi:plasmid stabilization system protein ParE